MLDFLDPAWFPQTFAAVLMGLVAAWLLFVDFNKPAHRVFASILVFRSINIVLAILRQRATEDATALFYDRLIPYVLLPIVPLTVYFLCVYPKPRTWLGKSKWGAPSVIFTIGILWALYAWDHALLWTFEAGQGEGILAHMRGYHYTSFGPLVLLTSSWTVVFSAVTVFLAFDYLDTANQSPRFSAMLIYAGFALNALFDGTLRVVQAAVTLRLDADYPWAPWGWAFAILPALTILPVLLSIFVLYTRRKIHLDVQRDIRRFLLVAPFPVASALALAAIGTNAVFFIGPGSFAHFVLGVWRLTLPILVSYALLRYDLFDIDHKVKAAVKHGTIIGAPVSVFFAVSEIAEALVQNQVSALYGAVAAIAISIAFKPLERVAHRLAARVFPRVRPFDSLSRPERLVLFEEQLRLAQQDGNVSPKEQRMLELLSQRLGLPQDPMSNRGARRRAAYP